MSGDCGHGWGYHFLGASFPCFACEGFHTKEAALRAAYFQSADLKRMRKALRTVRSKVVLVGWTPGAADEIDDVIKAALKRRKS